MKVLYFIPEHARTRALINPIMHRIQTAVRGLDTSVSFHSAQDRGIVDAENWDELLENLPYVDEPFDCLLIPFNSGLAGVKQIERRDRDLQAFVNFAKKTNFPLSKVVLYVEEGAAERESQIRLTAINAGIVNIHTGSGHLDELLARVYQAGLGVQEKLSRELKRGPFIIDRVTGQIFIENGLRKEIDITNKQKQLIKALASRSRLSKNDIMSFIYDDVDGEDRGQKIIDVFISHIRKKISSCFPNITDEEGIPNAGHFLIRSNNFEERWIASESELRESCPALFPSEDLRPDVKVIGGLKATIQPDGSAILALGDGVSLDAQEYFFLQALADTPDQWLPVDIVSRSIVAEDLDRAAKAEVLVESLRNKINIQGASQRLVTDRYGNVFFSSGGKSEGPEVINQSDYTEIEDIDGIIVARVKGEKDRNRMYDLIGPRNARVALSVKQAEVLRFYLSEDNRGRWINGDVVQESDVSASSQRVLNYHRAKIFDKLDKVGIGTDRFISTSGALWVLDQNGSNVPSVTYRNFKKIQDSNIVETFSMGGWSEVHVLDGGDGYFTNDEGKMFYLRSRLVELCRAYFSPDHVNKPFNGKASVALADAIFDGASSNSNSANLTTHRTMLCNILDAAGYGSAYRVGKGRQGTTFFEKDVLDSLGNAKDAWRHAVIDTIDAHGWGELHILPTGHSVFEAQTEGNEICFLLPSETNIFKHFIENAEMIVEPKLDAARLVPGAEYAEPSLRNTIWKIQRDLVASAPEMSRAFYAFGGQAFVFVPKERQSQGPKIIQAYMRRKVA